MTEKTNLVTVGNFRTINEAKKKEECYGDYLKTLAHSQLEIEVNRLMETLSTPASQVEIVSKGKLILHEITSRAHGQIQAQIEILNKEIPSIYHTDKLTSL